LIDCRIDSEHASPVHLETELYYQIGVHSPQLWTFFCTVAVRAQQLSPEQVFLDAQRAQQSGNNELAIHKYQQLLASHPEVVVARVNLGIALAALGR
jgi:hypothetical protein